MSIERLPDPTDKATAVEHQFNELAISKHQHRPSIPAEYDEDGQRICIDCEVVIPPGRIVAVNAVRCIECQEYDERQGSRYATRGQY